MASGDFSKHEYVDGVLTRAKPERARRALARLARQLSPNESVSVLAQCVRPRQPKCDWLAVTTQPRLLLLDMTAGVTLAATADSASLGQAGRRGGLIVELDGSTVRFTLMHDDDRAVLEAWQDALELGGQPGAVEEEIASGGDLPNGAGSDVPDAPENDSGHDGSAPPELAEPAEPDEGPGSAGGSSELGRHVEDVHPGHSRSQGPDAQEGGNAGTTHDHGFDPPGWYDDPWDRQVERWWDGFEWSDKTRDPPPPRSTSNRGGCLRTALIAGAILLVLGFFGNMIDSGGGGSGDNIGAVLACQDFVERQLRAPATADFPPARQATVTQQGSNAYRVSSHVDAENAFGAMIRSQWTCTVEYDNGTWRGTATVSSP